MKRKQWMVAALGTALLAATPLAGDVVALLTGGGGALHADGSVTVLGELAIGRIGNGNLLARQGALTCWIEPGPCAGDLTGDRRVNIDDLGLVLSNFGLSGPGIDGDVDGNGVVNIDDLGILLSSFGAVCV